MYDYIPRRITSKIEEAHKYYSVITVTGPRQSGKSTLCRHLYPSYKYVNLEDVATRVAATTDPGGFLMSLGKKVIIDEVQHVPDLLSQIQVAVDEDDTLRYILTGSSNFSLMEKVSQSLAGRSAVFTLLPFAIDEIKDMIGDEECDTIIYKGFYPGVLVKDIPPMMFYKNYYNTYVERDLRNLLKVNNIVNFDRFIRLLAQRVGSEFNAAALSREVGVSAPTITEWMSLLMSSYIVFQLPPYFNNVSKRITKSPKIYFCDCGLLSNLMGFKSSDQIKDSVMRGALFENMAVVELMKKKFNEGESPDLYFFREISGLEVDIVNPTADKVHLYEIKAGKTLQAAYSKNMRTLAEKLNAPAEMTVIYDGESFPPVAINVRDL